jgi:hypothetical protein
METLNLITKTNYSKVTNLNSIVTSNFFPKVSYAKTHSLNLTPGVNYANECYEKAHIHSMNIKKALAALSQNIANLHMLFGR